MSKINRSEYKKFLLSFFTEDSYQEKKINNHWLIKQWDGKNNTWVVHLYPEESYQNYKGVNSMFKELEEQNEHMRNI